MAWRFRAAPEEKRIMVFGQLESPWPVPGNILIFKNTAYFVSGRTSGTDGGLTIYALDIYTGKINWQKKLQRKRWKGKGVFSLADILVSDGKFVYLTASDSIIQFNPDTGDYQLKPRTVRIKGRSSYIPEPDPQYLIGRPLGLLEGSWRRQGSSLRPRKGGKRQCVYGNEHALMMAFSEDLLCMYKVGSGGWGNMEVNRSEFLGKKLTKGKLIANEKGWNIKVPRPFQFEAFLLAANTIFAAGTSNGSTAKSGELFVFSALNGKKISSRKMETPPVYNGMAAANGFLYVSTRDGKLTCFGKK